MCFFLLQIYSAMGYTIFMDENGDAQDNYTLVALGTKDNVSGLNFYYF